MSAEQLLNAISTRKAVNEFDLGQTFRMIESFADCAYDLIRFYRDNSELSVDDLLQHNAYAIRDFAVFDKGFAFHLWLINNKLSVPSSFVKQHGTDWEHIPTFCCESGIEYMNRKILTLPVNERSEKLNKLIKSSNYLITKDIELVLADSVVAENEVARHQGFNDRYVAYRTKIILRESIAADSVTKNGRHSLLWQTAKVVAKLPNLPTIQLDADCAKVVSVAHAFNHGV